MIKAIIFDVGGGLIDNPWPGMLDHYTKYLDVEKEKFMEVFKEMLDEWQTGNISEHASIGITVA